LCTALKYRWLRSNFKFKRTITNRSTN